MNPFLLQSHEALERHYSIVVDAKNAVSLRQSAILADIGLCLGLLIPKIHLYAKDRVLLASIYEDLDYIHQECSNRQIELSFDSLEWFRSADSPYGLGFVDDKRHQSFCWREKKLAINNYNAARAVALQFLGDPAALMEDRLSQLKMQR